MSNIRTTLKIFFPGRCYSVDRSYLYFIDKYIDGESIYLNYDKPRIDKKSEFILEKELDEDLNYSFNVLNNVDFDRYSEIILIGKSIGTIVASIIREKFNLGRARFICLTPLTETLKYVRQTDFIITSRADRFINLEELEKVTFKYPFLTIYDDLPHSLEYPTNYAKTIDLLKNNIDLILNYLDTAEKDLLG